MQFYIKNFDVSLCKIELYQSEITGIFSCKVISVYENDLCTALIGHDIPGWVLKRKPYIRRKNIEQLLARLGIKNIEQYFCLTFGLSLTDALWICPVDTSLLWQNINLYDNTFNKYVANFAFSGEGTVNRSTSPEFSTNGELPKCWKRLSGGIYLYKGGSEGYINSGREPFSEYYATQLLNAVQNTDYVSYTCKKYHNKIVSTCKLFTSKDSGFIPQSRMIPYYETFEQLFLSVKNSSYWDSFRKMLVFDTLIVNDDRHLGNFGYMRDNHTGAVGKFAPVFDNGCGCLTYYYNSRSEISESDIKKYIDAKAMSSGADFVTVAGQCLDAELRSILKNLKHFEFTAHPLDNRDIRIINIMLQYQLKKLVG